MPPVTLRQPEKHSVEDRLISLRVAHAAEVLADELRVPAVGEHGTTGVIAEHVEVAVDEITIRTRDVGKGLVSTDGGDMRGGALYECLDLLRRASRRRTACRGNEGDTKQAGEQRASKDVM
jgi:hypothetical protein